ncbi:MAG TPA: Holliday junction branch migration protein RuvA [bacterium]|jgi:Holliday junction DNA helicase RuvA|nr:Holliday junction branch migration protein RuvA [bacterium]HOG38396.1 Holliday junction branch migration protein RuvA [bacterium]HQI03354.1 Holliday junction branch migration protein RuvA [bacterium]
MIAYLKGKIIKKTDKSIILLVDDIGYEIFVSCKFLEKIRQDQDIDLFVYHKQREDAQELYGFSNFEEREFFIQLLSVPGVGPKSAINVLSISEVSDLKSAIATGDVDIFKKISGIGTKTAEKIIIELKSKLGFSGFSNNPNNVEGSDLEVFEALNALGFSDYEIRSIYNKIPKDIDTKEKVKTALKFLKK